jgi:TolB protein
MDERDDARLIQRIRALAERLPVDPSGLPDVIRQGRRGRRLATLGALALALVLAAAIVFPLGSLLSISEDDEAAPIAVLAPAPRDCPLGMSILRNETVDLDEFQRLMQGYLPRWLPSGFGLLRAIGRDRAEDGSDAAGVWSDDRCREVILTFNSSWRAVERGTLYDPSVPQVGPWSVMADAEDQCGNAVLGKGRCLNYATATVDGLLTLQMMGLERHEGDRIVLSIMGRSSESSPDLMGTIAYIEGRQGFGPIALLDAGSGESDHLTKDYFNSVGVAWSPDGSTIAMKRAILEGNGELVLVSSTTGEIVRTLPVDPLMNPIDVTWAPDGTSLAFTDTYADLWTIRVDGSDLRHRAIGGLRALDLDWSPDGSQIAFITEQGQLALIHPDRGDPRIIFDDARRAWFGPSWSPDGERIAFSAGTEGASQIFVIEADGSNLMQLTDDAEDSTDPTWSPDGAWIAFTRGGDHTDIYALTPDGSYERRMTDSPENEYGPDWGFSP